MDLQLHSTVEILCSYCKTLKDCITFPCLHNFCRKCYFDYYMPKITQLSYLLTSDPSVLNGACTYIGCPAYCKESALTISPDWLASLFESFNHFDNASVIRNCSSFLSGIPTYFIYCQNCRTTHVSVYENFKCDYDLQKVKAGGEQQDLQEEAVVRLLKISKIFNAFPYKVCATNDIDENAFTVLEHGIEYLIALAEDFTIITTETGGYTKVFKLTLANWMSYTYFAVAKAIITKEDEFGIYIITVDNLLILQKFKIIC